ncbi:MAG: SRPBCC family protein [Dehalococcoidia bacterium]
MTIAQDTQELTRPPVAKAAMLVRRPVAEVFEAFVDPAITSKFWFSKGSDRLEPGRRVRWDWEMYNVSTEVDVKAVEPNTRILIEWPGYGAPTTVEWAFAARADDTTFVSVTNAGFTGTGDEIAQQAIESTEGFTLVLAGLKALLEHGIALNLVPDHAPERPEEG